ncbi:EAL domain-containing protein [Candidatus Bealeia paramacronuclearis]|uniref:EAL domain-containing protein n=1 Tax=Candidatus Bealeia paramacronuclearis TaxID=1921001 RepID=A0ABZ2C4S3_9PROT|nr:EAL domain-containing protein [Candidatus Bealeia paramacronuclearis]
MTFLPDVYFVFFGLIMGAIALAFILLMRQQKTHSKSILLKLDHLQKGHQDVLKAFHGERAILEHLLTTVDKHTLSQSQAELDILSQIFEKLSEPIIEVAPKSSPPQSTLQPQKYGSLSLKSQPEVKVEFLSNPDEVLARLRKALKSDQVELLLQPVVSLPQRKPRFFECYSRIKALDGGVNLSPEHYIDIAEKAGLMPTIDNAILFRSIQIIRKVQKKQFSMGFFVNISERSISDRFFMESLIEFIDAERTILKGLYFELTNEAYSLLRSTENKLHGKLVQRGARFSLDQPNTLDLNIKELQEQGFSYVKVNQKLLIETMESQGPEFLKTLKKNLDKFNIDLIATKIEKEDELKKILDIHVDYGQGFLFGLPTLYQ